MIAGAALGLWSATKAEDYMQAMHRGPRAGLSIAPLHGGVGAGISARF